MFLRSLKQTSTRMAAQTRTGGVTKRFLAVRVLDDETAVEDFQSLNNKSVLYFTASWCSPCRMIKPIYEEMSDKYGDDVAFGKVDVDENADAALNFNISAVPTFIFCEGNKAIERFSGADAKALEDKVVGLKER